MRRGHRQVDRRSALLSPRSAQARTKHRHYGRLGFTQSNNSRVLTRRGNTIDSRTASNPPPLPSYPPPSSSYIPPEIMIDARNSQCSPPIGDLESVKASDRWSVTPRYRENLPITFEHHPPDSGSSGGGVQYKPHGRWALNRRGLIFLYKRI